MVRWEYSESLWDLFNAKFPPSNKPCAPLVLSLVKVLKLSTLTQMRERDKLGKPVADPLGFLIKRYASSLFRCIILHFHRKLTVTGGGGKETLVLQKIYLTKQCVKYWVKDCQDKVYVNDPVSVYSCTGM